MDSRLVRDIRILISAPRRIELAGAVDAEQAVVAGLVQVNDPRCPLDVGPRLIRLLVTIKCGDYREALKGIRKGAFVYFDPPYMPISSSASFTGYTAGGFGEEEQIALKEQCDMLNAKGIKFLLSNSSCEFIEDLYKDYIIDHVDAKRAINVKPEKRGEIQEVLVHNYELD